MTPTRLLGCSLVVSALLWYAGRTSPPPEGPHTPAPTPVVKPKRPLLPWRAEAKVGGATAPDGTPIHCDLPGDLHQKNTGGSDGAGLCVYASARHTGRWQNDPLFNAVFDWMKKHPGGSYPEKFERTLKQCAQELGLPVPDYIQITDSRDLEILRLACKTGRMPGVTYSRSPTGRYGGQRIAHMTSLVHMDDKWAAILDNNYVAGPGNPNAQVIEWMDPQREFLGVCNPQGYWAVILLSSPPPPPPSN